SPLNRWLNESAQSPYLPASYRLTTRASSAASFNRGASEMIGPRGAVCARSGAANSAIPNTARLVQKRDRLIRDPPSRTLWPGDSEESTGAERQVKLFRGKAAGWRRY